MSTSMSSSLAIASQQVVIYIGLFIFIAGIIGCPLVLLVFLSLKTFRQSSCAFYLTVMSFVNIFILFTSLLTLIMSNGFDINWTNMSLFYCKFRAFYVQFCALISFTCMCLATIDQFLATCSNPRWHRWNNIKFARYILLGAVIVWILHGIPFALYYDHILSPITNITSCTITNVIFQNYYNIFHIPALLSMIPAIIMTLFGVLAYRNVQKIAYRAVPLIRRALDKQLTKMVLVQVLYNFLAVVPLSIQTIIFIIIGSSSDSFVLLQRAFIVNLTYMLYCFHFVGSFYIYVCVSKRFRQQLIYVLFTIHLNRWRHPRMINNQIEPQI